MSKQRIIFLRKIYANNGLKNAVWRMRMPRCLQVRYGRVGLRGQSTESSGLVLMLSFLIGWKESVLRRRTMCVWQMASVLGGGEESRSGRADGDAGYGTRASFTSQRISL